jgi:hypothetical protein
MTRMLNEDLMTLAEATAYFPGSPHRATLYRYATQGIGGIRLETIRAGSRRLTSRQAIRRFIRQQNNPQFKQDTPGSQGGSTSIQGA